MVSYIGLDPVRGQVTVGAGQRAVRDFDLTTGIYKLDAFKVTGEREGGAAAITAQRNADNVKNVVAMDSFGNLPNMSAGEVAIRLPGVAGELNDEGRRRRLHHSRHGPGLNTVTIDGGLHDQRRARWPRAPSINNLTGAMFEQLELIKGHTPDKGADSLGGTINLKSRSPLSMREKRRITYNSPARCAPPFTAADSAARGAPRSSAGQRRLPGGVRRLRRRAQSRRRGEPVLQRERRRLVHAPRAISRTRRRQPAYRLGLPHVRTTTTTASRRA